MCRGGCVRAPHTLPALELLGCDLDNPAIELVELDGGTLAFGGRSWRIDAHAPRKPDGEASGEILPHLDRGRRWLICARRSWRGSSRSLPRCRASSVRDGTGWRGPRPRGPAIIVLGADEVAEEDENRVGRRPSPQLIVDETPKLFVLAGKSR